MQIKDLKVVFPFLLIYLILILANSQNGFFWDNVLQGSVHAQWYYENNFRKFFMPSKLVPYPTTFGIYLAAIWKLFGKNLFVSHLAILPFVWGIIYQFYKLIKKVSENVKEFYLIFLIILVNPTLLSQSILISPDLAITFFYIFALNCIINSKHTLGLIISLVLLGTLHPRGAAAVMCLGITNCALYYLFSYPKKSNIFKELFPFLISGVIILVWFYVFYLHYGWFIYSISYDVEYRSTPNISQFLINILSIGRVFFEFGMVILWLIVGISLYNVFKTKKVRSENFKLLIILFLVPMVILSVLFTLGTNPIGQRYFMTVSLLFLLFAAYSIKYITSINIQNASYIACIISLLFVQCISLPDKICVSWDSTLTHVPYYNLRNKLITYIIENKIDPEEVGSSFPNERSTNVIDLDNRNIKFANINFKENKYIFYSNIFNLNDDYLIELSKWKPIKVLKEGNVKVILYKKV